LAKYCRNTFWVSGMHRKEINEIITYTRQELYQVRIQLMQCADFVEAWELRCRLKELRLKIFWYLDILEWEGSNKVLPFTKFVLKFK